MPNKTSNEIIIRQVGLQAQWSDSGRRFSQLTGYSQSGAVDWFSYQLANVLCGNPLNSPCIEVVGGHFSFSINTYCLISITGAQADIHVNRQKVIINRILLLKPDDTVSIGQLSAGLFNYISFAATFSFPLFKHSICAVKREKVGGIRGDGNGLTRGEHLAFENKYQFSRLKVTELFENNDKPYSFVPLIHSIIKQQLSTNKQLPLIFCYQHTSFSNVDKRRILGHSYTVSPKLDKMGVRLDGPSIFSQSPVLTSQPISNGAVQVPGDGKPIIMRNDRQTIGGYPIIGVVNSIGLAVLSQATAGDHVCFVSTDIESSNIYRRFIEIQFNRVLNRVKSVITDSLNE